MRRRVGRAKGLGRNQGMILGEKKKRGGMNWWEKEFFKTCERARFEIKGGLRGN